jgi:2,5-diamino-6-(ribosylamino)-4(3H)-pyrimidinone 5'-phosphate reductase
MLPRVILHMGVSVDGRYDWAVAHDSPYYEIVQLLEADADLSGSQTMLKAYLPDDPKTAFPGVYERWTKISTRPLLAVVDSQGQIRNWDVIKRQPWWRTAVALCSHATPQSHRDDLQQQGVDTIVAGDERVDLRVALEELRARYQVKVLRVDSGGVLNGVLLRAGLVDEVSVVISPELVGGTTTNSMFIAPDLSSASGVIPLKLLHVSNVKEDFVWLRYEVVR